MNSNFLCQVYGVSGYRLCGQCHKDSETILKIERKHKRICCLKCGNMGVSFDGSSTRDILGVPSGLRKTVLRVRMRRYKCRRCGHVFQDRVPFAKGNRHYSRRFAQYVVELLKACTVKSVASLLRVSWDTVKRIHKEHLRRRYSPPPLKGVRNIGIDEFSVRRGVEFRTIVVDLDTGRIVHVGKGRGGDALLPFWRRVKRLGVQIRYVATDLSAAFIASVLENAPGAKLVFDHFHVVKLMNEALDDIRRTLYRHERSVMRRRVLLGTRYLLLRNAEDILDTKYRTRLDNALALNEPLSKAYYMKEALRGIWMQPTKDAAGKELYAWVEQARKSKVPRLERMAATLMARRTGILAWYDCRFSTAKVEGINNKIKVLKRSAYGFRDDKYFKLRLFALHDSNIQTNCG